MSEESRTDKLVTFMHIPKAAGTTLRKIIEKQYKPEELISFNHPNEIIPRLKTMSQQDLNKVKCLSGHAYFGTFHQYFSKQFTYITLMRNPIDRVISEYYFLLNTPVHPDHHKVKDVSFQDFIRLKEFRGRAENAQTRYFSGTYHSPNLKTAVQNINNHFLVVGTLERFDESLFMINHELGWKDVPYIKRNKTKSRPLKEEISAEIIQFIKEKNQMDMELYEYVKERFQQKIDSLPPNSKDRLNQFIRNKK